MCMPSGLRGVGLNILFIKRVTSCIFCLEKILSLRLCSKLNKFNIFYYANKIKLINQKITFFRIGISFQALYIALIMILKENIINFVIPVAIVRGLADGFYYFPKNILDTEKVDNESRQKYNGLINIISTITSIVIPIILGVLLTFYSYISISKIFFILFIVLYVITFSLKGKEKYNDKNIEWRRFFKLVKTNRNIRYVLLGPLLCGFTYASGVMGMVITLFKIYNFKTSLNLGVVEWKRIKMRVFTDGEIVCEDAEIIQNIDEYYIEEKAGNYITNPKDIGFTDPVERVKNVTNYIRTILIEHMKK